MHYYQFNFPHQLEKPVAISMNLTKVAILTEDTLSIFTQSMIFLWRASLPSKFNTVNFIRDEYILLGGDSFYLYNIAKNSFNLLSDAKCDNLSVNEFECHKFIKFYFSINHELYKFSLENNKKEVQLIKRFSSNITALIKIKKKIIIGEESGLVTFIKDDIQKEIKISHEVHSIRVLDTKDTPNKYFLVTDKKGYAYILNEDLITHRIKVRDDYIFGCGTLNTLYFIGFDSRLTKYKKVEEEYVKESQDDVHFSEVISFINNKEVMISLSKDSSLFIYKEGIKKRIFPFSYGVKYSNDLLVYKESDQLNFYKFNKKNEREFTNVEEGLSFLNVNTSHVNYQLRMNCKGIINYDILNDHLVYSDSKNIYLFKLVNNNVLLINTFNKFINYLLFSKYLLLINDNILIYDLERMSYLENKIKYDYIIKSTNYILIGTKLYDKYLNEIDVSFKGKIHSIRESDSKIYFMQCMRLASYILGEYELSNNSLIQKNSFHINNIVVRDFLVKNDTLFICDSHALFYSSLLNYNIKAWELEETIDSLHYSDELIISKFDYRRSIKDISKGADKKKYNRK
ncbi:hypothetical protein H311_02957 [Anncaliia algerae PRA109]|nr:hypothetical protein H311_02957 [Anncaliia algerae PRA109]